MKIDNSAKTVGTVQGPAAVARSPAAPVSKAASSATDGPTTVVATAFHSVAGAEAAFDSKKVAEIRQAISEGRFQINPERIADGLINSVQELLGKNRRNA